MQLLAPHALVVPASGQGHINPCMMLARALSHVGFHVSFVYFSTDYAQQKNKSLPDEASRIAVYVIEDGLSSEPLPLDSVPLPLRFTTAMKENLYELIVKLGESKDVNGYGSVTCVVSDSFAYWTQDVADRAGVPRVEFWTSTAMAYSMVLAVPELYRNGIFPEKGCPKLWEQEAGPLMIRTLPGIAPIPTEHYPVEIRYAEKDSYFGNFFTQVAQASKRSQTLLVHTIPGLEKDAFKALASYHAHVPIYPVGPLLVLHRQLSQNGNTQSLDDNGRLCLSWLDRQAPGSVLYVAFGSYAPLSGQEIYELAIGLEASGQPFLWALREQNLNNILPEGFLARINEKGLIVPWAPQLDVLAHNAVGAFLSHCGWNSTVESLCFGVPMIACPRGAEQRSNADYISRVWGVGFEIERTSDGGMDGRVVASYVRRLMQDEVGQHASCKAKEVMQLARLSFCDGGESLTNLQKLYIDMKAKLAI